MLWKGRKLVAGISVPSEEIVRVRVNIIVLLLPSSALVLGLPQKRKVQPNALLDALHSAVVVELQDALHGT